MSHRKFIKSVLIETPFNYTGISSILPLTDDKNRKVDFSQRELRESQLPPPPTVVSLTANPLFCLSHSKTPPPLSLSHINPTLPHAPPSSVSHRHTPKMATHRLGESTDSLGDLRLLRPLQRALAPGDGGRILTRNGLAIMMICGLSGF